jgi:hypothetical protein
MSENSRQQALTLMQDLHFFGILEVLVGALNDSRRHQEEAPDPKISDFRHGATVVSRRWLVERNPLTTPIKRWNTQRSVMMRRAARPFSYARTRRCSVISTN